MKINIKITNFDLTPAIKQYIEKKLNYLDKFLSRYTTKGEAEVDFEVGRTTRHHKKGEVFYAKANLKTPDGFFRANKTNDDLFTAIDEVKSCLLELIKKHKTKKDLNKRK
ncbi:MAG: ribosome-associated translation inhibitor RaiA [Candidatus Liptonbacteria bacterium]|nr:ribosome-associated translation inhibitor RaiA [Candidatus Liptonbacteria bacterium]